MMLITNATAFLHEKLIPDFSVLIQDQKIAAIGENIASKTENTLNLQGDFLLPGFVDVHIHAFMGQDVMYGEEAIRHMSRELLKFGVSAFLPTTMSASPEATQKALCGIKAVMEQPEPQGALVLGAHLEAPFLNHSKAGAQRKEFFSLPTEDAWQQNVGEYESIIRLITLAPELDGALPFIRQLTEKGICVSIGHTDATAELIHEAAQHGAKQVTHTFNAQSPLTHRAPGVPGAALTDNRLSCQFICDGIHLHPDIVRLILRCKGKHLAIAITDAMEAAGMPEGEYQLGGQAVFVKNNAARLKDGTLAGSTLTLAKALQNMIAYGVPPEEAALTVTKTPALSIGNHVMGDLSVIGAPAIFARFRKDWTFAGTICVPR